MTMTSRGEVLPVVADKAMRLTAADIARGWVPLACGCHAFVFRAEVLAQLSHREAEWCPAIQGWAVPIAAVESVASAATGPGDARLREMLEGGGNQHAGSVRGR